MTVGKYRQDMARKSPIRETWLNMVDAWDRFVDDIKGRFKVLKRRK